METIKDMCQMASNLAFIPSVAKIISLPSSASIPEPQTGGESFYPQEMVMEVGGVIVVGFAITTRSGEYCVKIYVNGELKGTGPSSRGPDPLATFHIKSHEIEVFPGDIVKFSLFTVRSSHDTSGNYRDAYPRLFSEIVRREIDYFEFRPFVF